MIHPNLPPEILQRLQIKIRAKNGQPAMVYNPKDWMSAIDAARLAQILPMLFQVRSSDIPWHDVIREFRVSQHFDVYVPPVPVDDGSPTQTLPGGPKTA